MPDLFDVWRERLARTTSRSGRVTANQERAYWREHAARYDERGSLARGAPAVVQRVVSLVPPGATVLEIGAGTGEFTLPVAQIASHVTALDISPDMLAVLEQKARARGITNITRIEADWERSAVAQHDVILAVNSLYRLQDPCVALNKILASVHHRGILVRSIGTNPPAPQAALRAFGATRFDESSDHELLAAGLIELGAPVNVELIATDRVYQFQSVDEAAAVCLPWRDRTESEWLAARNMVRDTMHIDTTTQVVTYNYQGRVAIITWEASGLIR